MTALPRAILFDLDDTILALGDRKRLLIEAAEEFRSDLGPLTPVEVGEALEAAFREFWADVAGNNVYRSKPRLRSASPPIPTCFARPTHRRLVLRVTPASRHASLEDPPDPNTS